MMPVKKKRKCISLETKIKILNRIENGEGSTSLGKSFDVNEATIRTIKRNESIIRRSVMVGTKLSSKYSSYTRCSVMEKTEKALAVWIEDNNQKRVPLDGNTIKQKALHIYAKIEQLQPSDSMQAKKTVFSASTGWLRAFLNRNSLHNVQIKGEIGSANEKSAKEFPEKLARIIEEGGYTPDQVFNADETGLFWKKMPKRTYVARSEKVASGFKAAKERITLLFCSNASRDRQLKPLFINKTLKPRAMKNKNVKTLPVHWMANNKAWVTSLVFTEWFNTCFIPEVKVYMEEKGLEFKILLLIDNAPGNPHLEHPNVKIVFLPPNTTSLLQPQDQGIIATFKTYYLKQSFQYILDKLENGRAITVIDARKKFSIMDCVKFVNIAVHELKPSTLNACWKAVWSDCVKDKNCVPPISTEYSNIINLSMVVGGIGFEDLAFEDIEEVILDPVISDESLIDVALEGTDCREKSGIVTSAPLSAGLIIEGLQLAEKLENIFVENDPNFERGLKFQKDLKFCMARYKELLKDINKSVPNNTSTAKNSRDSCTSLTSQLLYENTEPNISSEESECEINFKPVSRKRIRISSDTDSD